MVQQMSKHTMHSQSVHVQQDRAGYFVMICSQFQQDEFVIYHKMHTPKTIISCPADVQALDC